MRLRDIVNKIDENLGLLNPKTPVIKNDPHNLKLGNIFNIRNGVSGILSTNAFKNEIKNIKEFESLFLSVEDSIVLPKAEVTKLVAHINGLKNKMTVFRSVALEILPEQSELSLSIKLPKIHDLSDLSDVSSRLEKLFNQLLVNKYVEGNASLQNFDTGSEWVEIAFNSVKALGAVTSLVYIVILTKREKIKNDESLEIVRNRRITNDLYEKFGKELLENTEKFIDKKVAENLHELGVEDSDNEYSERYKYCAAELSKLIDQGLQFFPSSKSPNEIKSTLPDFLQKNIKDMLPQAPQLETTNKNTEQVIEENG